jgi:single-strand DNA-binding protein
MSTRVTIIGNLASDPELRFTADGTQVATFTVLESTSVRDRNTNEWKDGPLTPFRCNAWRTIASNINDTLRKGMRVVVTGRMSQNEWETRDGEKRYTMEITVDDIGPSLKFAKASVEKVNRTESISVNNNTASETESQSQNYKSQAENTNNVSNTSNNDDPWGDEMSSINPDF